METTRDNIAAAETTRGNNTASELAWGNIRATVALQVTLQRRREYGITLKRRRQPGITLKRRRQPGITLQRRIQPGISLKRRSQRGDSKSVYTSVNNQGLKTNDINPISGRFSNSPSTEARSCEFDCYLRRTGCQSRHELQSQDQRLLNTQAPTLVFYTATWVFYETEIYYYIKRTLAPYYLIVKDLKINNHVCLVHNRKY